MASQMYYVRARSSVSIANMYVKCPQVTWVSRSVTQWIYPHIIRTVANTHYNNVMSTRPTVRMVTSTATHLDPLLILNLNLNPVLFSLAQPFKQFTTQGVNCSNGCGGEFKTGPCWKNKILEGDSKRSWLNNSWSYGMTRYWRAILRELIEEQLIV